MNKKIVVAIVLAVIVVLLGGVLLMGISNDKDKEIPFYTTDEEVFLIETPYCDLSYPAKWKEELKTEEIENGNSYTIKFHAAVDGQNITLFDVCFNGEEGTPVGTFKENGETVQVNIVNYEPDFSMYSEEQQNKLYEMVDAVNVVISKLIEDNNLELV